MRTLSISCAPIIGEKDVVVDVFDLHSDLSTLLRKRELSHESTIRNAVKTRGKILACCKKTDTLEKALTVLSNSRMQKCIIVDDSMKFVGIISPTDFFEFLVKHLNDI